MRFNAEAYGKVFPREEFKQEAPETVTPNVGASTGTKTTPDTPQQDVTSTSTDDVSGEGGADGDGSAGEPDPE